MNYKLSKTQPHACSPATLQGLLDLMIMEEEGLKDRLLKSIQSCREEIKVLQNDLQLPPFEVQSPWIRCCLYFRSHTLLNSLVLCGRAGGKLHHAADGEEQSHASGGDEGAQEAANGGAQGPRRQRPGAVRHHVHDTVWRRPQLCAVAPDPAELPRLLG